MHHRGDGLAALREATDIRSVRPIIKEKTDGRVRNYVLIRIDIRLRF